MDTTNTAARAAQARMRPSAYPLATAHCTTRSVLARALVALCIPVALSGCLNGNGLAFAPAKTEAPGSSLNTGRALTAVFGEGQLVLAAPTGFCFDPQMETHTASGGFALLAPCERMTAFGRLRSHEGALLTVTIGKLGKNAPKLTAEALKNAFIANRSAARVLETRKDATIPLVKLFTTDHSAAGASGTHWRGAFVVRGHLVSVALYAPDGSRYLGDKGARLIQEFMRATQHATQLAKATTPASPSESTPKAMLRPKARPTQHANRTTNAAASG